MIQEAEVDPIRNFADALAVPGQVLGQVAVAFGAVIAEAFQHIQTHFFRTLEIRHSRHDLIESRNEVNAAPLGLQAPGLVIDPGEDRVHLFTGQFLVRTEHSFGLCPLLDRAADLPMCTLHPVAQADGFDPAVFVAGPGVHRHRVGIVQQDRAGLRDFADVFTKIQQGGNGPLGIHQAACTQRVADALIYPVLQGNIDVGLERFQAALPDHAEHIIGISEGLAPAGRRFHRRRQPVGRDVAPAKLRHHIHVMFGNIMEGKFGVGQLRHRQNIA